MKAVTNINAEENPALIRLHKLVSKAIDQVVADEVPISPLSTEAFMKRIEEGKLTLNEMDDDMKISQSKFRHYYTPEGKEVIIQITEKKLAVFSD